MVTPDNVMMYNRIEWTSFTVEIRYSEKRNGKNRDCNLDKYVHDL